MERVSPVIGCLKPTCGESQSVTWMCMKICISGQMWGVLTGPIPFFTTEWRLDLTLRWANNKGRTNEQKQSNPSVVDLD